MMIIYPSCTCTASSSPSKIHWLILTSLLVHTSDIAYKWYQMEGDDARETNTTAFICRYASITLQPYIPLDLYTGIANTYYYSARSCRKFRRFTSFQRKCTTSYPNGMNGVPVWAADSAGQENGIEEYTGNVAFTVTMDETTTTHD